MSTTTKTKITSCW